MSELQKIFRRFTANAIHVAIIPIFFMLFMIALRPMGVFSLLSTTRMGYGFHIIMLSCILLGCILPYRFSLHFAVHNKLSYIGYTLWCLAEITTMIIFCALYLCLTTKNGYFEMIGFGFRFIITVLSVPYLLIFLIAALNNSELRDENQAERRLRFYDDRHILRFVVELSSIIYIAAEENYVRIYYREGSDRVKEKIIRISMKRIEELNGNGGLVRCHRSYFVHPDHVRILSKDAAGVLFAEMDDPSSTKIPVTKRYYDNLSNLL